MEALDVDMTARVGQHEGDMQCPACPSTWRTTVKGHEIEKSRAFNSQRAPKVGAYVVKPRSGRRDAHERTRKMDSTIN
jgi:hypothetical protein